jgi:prepilin-type N-terminal cleavage/methylation domain-containing protein
MARRSSRFSRPGHSAALSGQAGYTLIELLVVMGLLAIVLGGIVTAYVSANRGVVDQTQRADDQEVARITLERMRRDIHCASGGAVQATLDSVTGLPTGGYTLLLTVAPGQCLGVTDTSDGVEWCTVSVGGATNRWEVYRSTNTVCDASDANFEVDHITQPQIWGTACSSAHLLGISIDMPVNRDPVTRPARTYTLRDTIALRNDSVSSSHC